MTMIAPRGIDYVHAAAIPEVFVNVHEALLRFGRLEAGRTVLIHAAVGGGSVAVHLAHAMHVHVLATTKKDEHSRVVELGVNTLVDCQNPGLRRGGRI